MPRKIEVQIVGDARSLEKAFGRATKAGESFGDKFGRGVRNVGKHVAVAAGAITALGVVTSKSFAPFEETLDRVVGLAGGAREEVEQFGDQILKLATQVGKGPQELAEALYFTASAGVAAADQMEVVTRAAQASAAGLGETQIVADAVTSAMNAYGTEIVDAARATDVLVATVKEGKGEADAFAPVIGTVAAIAAELGVAFEEVGAALAAQTRLGIGAETAAVNLQAVFSSLLKEAPKTSKALKVVGLSHEGLRQQLKEKGLLSVLTTLKERFGDNTAAMAEAFPNIRALRGLLSLVGAQSEETAALFGRMKDSTGALDLAFKSVSEGEAFKFKQTMASLGAISIRVGALFAPVAKKLADGANAALGVLTTFIEDLSEAHTIRQKLEVVWEGAQGAATGAFNAVKGAIAGVDWGAVWEGAKGLADGLQDQLEQVDWGFIGENIGAGIKAAAGALFPAAQEIADRLSEAMRTIKWEELGKAMGPGLAAAIVTAFTTLLDPAFWIRNWDLALAVAITAFTGPLGKLGSFLLRPFAKLGGDLVLRLGVGMLDAAPRLGGFLLKLLGALPGLALKALQPLIRVYTRIFKRLGAIGRFVVKVLGIQAAINAVVGLARRVGRFMGNLGKTIGEAFKKAFDYIHRLALRAAIKIIEPFTHIPGFLGGGAFQDMQTEWQATLTTMESDAKVAAKNINASMGTIKGPVMPQADFPATRTPEERAQHLRQPPTEEKDVQTAAERAAAAEKRRKAAIAAALAAKKKAAEAAKKAAAAAKKAREAQRKAYEGLIDALTLKLEIAGATATFADDLRAQQVIIDAIQKQIRIEGKTTDLMRQLFQAQQERLRLEEEQRAKVTAARQARQFRALGLTGEGQERVAGVKSLTKRLGTLRDRIKGTVLDTAKTRSQLNQIAKVLSGGFGKVGRDVRSAITGMFDEIAGALQDGTRKAPITRFRKRGIEQLIAGLGLTTQQIRELRSRLSATGAQGMAPVPSKGGVFGMAAPLGAVGGGGGGNVIVNGNIVVQDPRDADAFIREVQKKAKRGTASRRGVRAGTNRGMS